MFSLVTDAIELIRFLCSLKKNSRKQFKKKLFAAFQKKNLKREGIEIILFYRKKLMQFFYPEFILLIIATIPSIFIELDGLAQHDYPILSIPRPMPKRGT
jgi:hypothetical protein